MSLTCEKYGCADERRARSCDATLRVRDRTLALRVERLGERDDADARGELEIDRRLEHVLEVRLAERSGPVLREERLREHGRRRGAGDRRLGCGGRAGAAGGAARRAWRAMGRTGARWKAWVSWSSSSREVREENDAGRAQPYTAGRGRRDEDLRRGTSSAPRSTRGCRRGRGGPPLLRRVDGGGYQRRDQLLDRRDVDHPVVQVGRRRRGMYRSRNARSFQTELPQSGAAPFGAVLLEERERLRSAPASSVTVEVADALEQARARVQVAHEGAHRGERLVGLVDHQARALGDRP